MFLPGLMVRDFGRPGWLAFMLPNVIGAAAMGWVLSRESSLRMVTNHRWICLGFSVVTIAFHLFWLGWFVRLALGPQVMVATLLATGIILLVGGAGGRRDRILAGLVLCVSLVVMGLSRHWDLPRYFEPSYYQTLEQALFDRGLIYLLPVCVFGFAFCPYLDLTFHRAAQATTDRARKIAFTVGFGVLFFLMIYFSLNYSMIEHKLLRWGHVPGENEDAIRQAVRQWMPLLAVHIALQAAFTIAVHARAVSQHLPDRNHLPIAVLSAIGVAGAVSFVQRVENLPIAESMSHGEAAYKIFMGFYGLVFPAYVWIVMLPNRRRNPHSAGSQEVASRGPTRSDWGIWSVTVLLSMPMFWAGFLLEHMAWLGAGLGLVLVVGAVRMVLPVKPAGSLTENSIAVRI